jgi:hypothetical protein
MAQGRESSKIVEAIAAFCARHKDDPNLFPPKGDRIVLDNTQGTIISDHKVSSEELALLHNHPSYYGTPTARIQELN